MCVDDVHTVNWNTTVLSVEVKHFASTTVKNLGVQIVVVRKYVNINDVKPIVLTVKAMQSANMVV